MLKKTVFSVVVIGSLLGFLPQAIIFSLIGSGLVEESLSSALSRIWLAIPILGVAAFTISRVAARDPRTIPG